MTSLSAGERRLVVTMGAVVFVDTMFYAAIAPLLPSLAHSFHLSKLSAGVMTASYPAGTLIGSLPGGILAVRAGPKRTVYAGLTLLAASTLAFGFLNNVPGLDAARFVEGIGGACSWAGGIAWIVAETSAERRGGLIGAALAAAIGGALFGPVIGTIATAVGRAGTFSAVVVIALVLILLARRLPLTHAASGQGLRQLFGALRWRRVQAAMWLVALPAVASGMINVLGPLRLHRLGATAGAIGATFLVAAAAEAVVSPAIGRLSDRRGRLLPMGFGLAGAAVLLACFTLPASALVLALLIVVIAATLGGFWAPAMAMLSDAAEAFGLDQALAAALMNPRLGRGADRRRRRGRRGRQGRGRRTADGPDGRSMRGDAAARHADRGPSDGLTLSRLRRGRRRARAGGRGAAAVALVAFVAGCGTGPTPPSQIAENYINTIAEGNFVNACAMIPSAARTSFASLIGRRTTCAQAFKRCVPEQATNTAQDQTQLLYANVQTMITGSTAVVDLSGTTVARAVKQVDLTERHSVWSLSTYGTGLRACAIASHRRR